VTSSSSGLVILGIDPGSRCTGYGVVRETSGCLELLGTGTIRTNGQDDLSTRLDTIFTRICSLIHEFSPDQAAVEEVFTSKNASSALKLGQARGAVIVACSHQKVPVYSYEPTLVKKSLVGGGRAGKEQVAFMVAQMLGCKPRWAQDASDALAVAIAHLNQRRAAGFGGFK